MTATLWMPSAADLAKCPDSVRDYIDGLQAKAVEQATELGAMDQRIGKRELVDWLRDYIAHHKEELEETRRDAPASYGHGCEAGALSAYMRTLDYVRDGE